jgi:hypothetical protein
MRGVVGPHHVGYAAPTQELLDPVAAADPGIGTDHGPGLPGTCNGEGLAVDLCSGS